MIGFKGVFAFFHQLENTIDPITNACANDGNKDVVTEHSVEDQHHNLAAINLDTLNRLGKDHDQGMSATCHLVGASSFPQRVSEELISTCVIPRREKQVQAALEKKRRGICVR